MLSSLPLRNSSVKTEYNFFISFHSCYNIAEHYEHFSCLCWISKTDDYLKILTGDEVKNFVIINFAEYFKSTREKLYSKLSEEQSEQQSMQ